MERLPVNEFGEPNMGSPSVRFDEGRESVGHWPMCLSTHPFPPTLQNRDSFYPVSVSSVCSCSKFRCHAVDCGNYLSGMRAWSQSPMREAEGLSRLHNTITDWPDSGYTRRIPFIPGAPPPWP